MTELDRSRCSKGGRAGSPPSPYPGYQFRDMERDRRLSGSKAKWRQEASGFCLWSLAPAATQEDLVSARVAELAACLQVHPQVQSSGEGGNWVLQTMFGVSLAAFPRESWVV